MDSTPAKPELNPSVQSMGESKGSPAHELSPPGEAGLYRHSFFDKEFPRSRKVFVGIFLLPLLYTTLLLWACLSLYWGSTVSTSLSKLSVYAINLDDGALGQQVIDGIQSVLTAGGNNLKWEFDASITSAAQSIQIIDDEQAWAVVQINSNVSSSLATAIATGSKSYNPLDAVTIYYASGRNQITTNSKVVPAILAVVNPLLVEAGGRSTGEFLGANAGNSSAITTALQCQGCLASPFAASQVDLHPFDVNTATGSTMVGLIFLLTFTFSIFQIVRINGEVIGAELNIVSAIGFRTVAALSSYLILSLSYTLVNLAFGVPMSRFYGHAGFLIYWMLNACTMGSVGLPMESLFTLLGLKWAGYFLSFWIIVNVASSFTSFDLMPGFYRYGYGFPFFNSIQGARTIIFGTKNHLGQNFGIMIAWMIVGWVGMALLTVLTLRSNRKKQKHTVR